LTRECSCRDNAVQMKVVHEFLIPYGEHGDEAELGFFGVLDRLLHHTDTVKLPDEGASESILRPPLTITKNMIEQRFYQI